MGLSRTYWRFRILCNTGGSLAVALFASAGHLAGIPPLFRGSYEAFVKAAEVMLSVGSSLLGFIIAAVTLIYALTADQRFGLLRASRSFGELASASKGAMFWLLVASILGAALLLIAPDTFEHARKALVFLTAFVAAEVAISTAALTWVISRLISLA